MIKLQIVGNLGRDGVLKEVNGKNVINFSVAHTERFRDASGNQQERTTWVDCSYWTDRTGVAPYLKKGTLVYAEGTPTAEAYTGRDGNAGVALRLRVFSLQLLGPSPRNEGNGTEVAVGTQDYGAQSGGSGTEVSDDLPF
ncbi:single-stranded DNA-binding protein [Dinghuibacter silviterrae]|uniref:Single-stranded DNA-binding protein n=1 Tax=Dinghuibacter silviterrae TaxID=1539049 RepID=A0A4R8DR00_9BACT|nr:single-stranded DNA-binding protein [Dinghuibacter silviterrae]TDX00590.1 single-strand DNA-binding protein [Dinghuibacter silviterrae]